MTQRSSLRPRPPTGVQVSIPRPSSPAGTQPSIPSPDFHPRTQNSIQGLDLQPVPRLDMGTLSSIQSPVLYWVPQPISGAHSSIQSSGLHPGHRHSDQAKKYIPRLRHGTQNPVMYQGHGPLSGTLTNFRTHTFSKAPEAHPEAHTSNPESSPISGANTSVRGSLSPSRALTYFRVPDFQAGPRSTSQG